MHRIQRRALVIALALVIGAAAPSPAATVAGLHQTSTIAALRLNAGKRWPTDGYLRKAMVEIREAMFAQADAFFLGTISDASYDALARRINAQAADIIENCQLPAEADAQLHLILTQIAQGSAAMQGRDPNLHRRGGAERIVAALDAYSRYFNHPGWKPVLI
jgi:hypothetical protein